MSASDTSSDAPSGASIDPTSTLTLRERYASRLRGGYASINAQITEDVGDRDVFGLKDGSEQLAIPSSPPNVGGNYDPTPLSVSADSPLSRQVEAFLIWLHQQQLRGVLGPLSRQYNAWLIEAYERGLTQAAVDLRQLGVEVEDVPRTQRQNTLDAVSDHHFTDLEGVVGAVETEASRELNEALQAGVAAYILVKRLKDRLNKIGKTRATTFAHSAVVRTYNEGLLDRYQASGVEHVGAEIELEVDGPHPTPGTEEFAQWLTANDFRVCPECRALQGRVWPIDEAPMPVLDTHLRCRCRLRVILRRN